MGTLPTRHQGPLFVFGSLLDDADRRLEHVERAVRQFEQFCTVTRSVGAAIPISVEVRDATGAVVS